MRTHTYKCTRKCLCVRGCSAARQQCGQFLTFRCRPTVADGSPAITPTTTTAAAKMMPVLGCSSNRSWRNLEWTIKSTECNIIIRKFNENTTIFLAMIYFIKVIRNITQLSSTLNSFWCGNGVKLESRMIMLNIRLITYLYPLLNWLWLTLEWESNRLKVGFASIPNLIWNCKLIIK